MKDILKNLITILIVVVIGILIGRYVLGDDDQIKKVREQIARTQAEVDSLKKVNTEIAKELARVEKNNRRLEEEKMALQQAVDSAVGRLNRIVKEINAYVGTKTDLVRELNRILAVPLQPLPN
jgi:septal ring factor EnvC (AmiA/AmiB activator)